MTTMPELLTVTQAAQYLQVPPATIYDWLTTGRLQGYKIGGHAGKPGKLWRIPKTAIQTILTPNH